MFCHGTPWSSLVWADVARRLAEDYRVLVWDMSGYGRSTMNADVPVDLSSQMRRFTALLDHWGLDRPQIVGHDIGGAVGLGAHLLHGREFASLYLWDTVTLEPWGTSFLRLVTDRQDAFAGLPLPLHAGLVREYIASATADRLPEEWLNALIHPWTTGPGYRQMAQLSPDHTGPVATSPPSRPAMPSTASSRSGWRRARHGT